MLIVYSTFLRKCLSISEVSIRMLSALPWLHFFIQLTFSQFLLLCFDLFDMITFPSLNSRCPQSFSLFFVVASVHAEVQFCADILSLLGYFWLTIFFIDSGRAKQNFLSFFWNHNLSLILCIFQATTKSARMMQLE